MIRIDSTNQPAADSSRDIAPAPRTSYAAKRSAAQRPVLSLHDFHAKHRARSLQLGWVGLIRPRGA